MGMFSIRTTLKGEEAAVEALRKSKAKFPGRQLVYVSRNWGFSPFPKDVFVEVCLKSNTIDWKGAIGTIKADGVAPSSPPSDLCVSRRWASGTSPRATSRSA